MSPDHAWPELDGATCAATLATLHLHTQIIGKVQLALRPPLAQWEQAPLRLTARGLESQLLLVPDGRTMTITLDLIDREARLETSDGTRRTVALVPSTVAEFHAGLMAALRDVDAAVSVGPLSVLTADPVAYESDTSHGTCDEGSVRALFRTLTSVAAVFEQYRAGFWGKQSPVNFWWGTFDLAVARYSSRAARPPQDAGLVDRVAMDAEQATVGFWPGDAEFRPRFFAYTYPIPRGLATATVGPEGAAWDADLGQFALPYDDVRAAPDPDAALLEFCESTYDAGSRLGNWDKRLLDRPVPSAAERQGSV